MYVCTYVRADQVLTIDDNHTSDTDKKWHLSGVWQHAEEQSWLLCFLKVTLYIGVKQLKLMSSHSDTFTSFNNPTAQSNLVKS